MNKKYLFAIGCLVIISVSSLFLGLKHLENKSVSEMLGSYTFANTKNTLFKLGRVVLSNSNQEKINLYYDGIWHFEEAADYFTDENSMRNLYNMINSSVLVENINFSENETKNVFNIKTFDTVGNLLDDIYLSEDDISNVKYAGKENWYKASNLEKLSFSPADWLPYPLLSVTEDLISAVNVNNHHATKASLEELKQVDDKISTFFEILSEVDYDGIMSEELFYDDYEAVPFKEIKIYLLGGLNYCLQIYDIDGEYYLKILPEREVIARKEISEIINLKKIYYDNWLFKLNDKHGAFLYNFSLAE